MSEVGAVETQCAGLVHAKEVAGVAAGHARPRIVCRDHDDPLGWARWALDDGLRSVGRRPMGAVGAFGVGIAVSGELQDLVGRSLMSLIGDDRLKKINDLLLSGGHAVELPAHLGEAVVDMRT